jgi:hypothetical protein
MPQIIPLDCRHQWDDVSSNGGSPGVVLAYALHGFAARKLN